MTYTTFISFVINKEKHKRNWMLVEFYLGDNSNRSKDPLQNKIFQNQLISFFASF